MKAKTRAAALMVGVLGLCGQAQAQEAQAPASVLEAQGAPLPEGGWRSGTGSPQWRALVERVHAAPPLDRGLHDNPRPALALATLREGRNLIVMEDEDGRIMDTGLASVQGESLLREIAAAVYAQHPDEFDFITIILNWSVQVPFAFYLPLANETRGLGLRNVPPYRDTFDNTEGKLQGFIFMNNWRFYTGNNANLSRVVWLQEIGHRWGSFVNFDKGDGRRGDLLGRDMAHWSYFMHTQNSALEGNDWQDNGDGSFTTLSNSSRMSYGSLDRYLMGLVPSQDVEPFYFIDDPDTRNQRDSQGGRISPASPPEPAGELKTVLGRRVDVSIEDIVRAEGSRDPSYLGSQREWRMATVFLVRQGSEVSEAEFEGVQDLVDYWEALFEEATRDEMDLIVNLDGSQEERGVALGGACARGDQCDQITATTCLVEEGAQGGVCTRRCAASAECGEGFCCEEAGGGRFCVAAEGVCADQVEEDLGPAPDQGAGDMSGDDAGIDGDEVAAMASAPDEGGCGCQSVAAAPRGVISRWLGWAAPGLGRRRR